MIIPIKNISLLALALFILGCSTDSTKKTEEVTSTDENGNVIIVTSTENKKAVGGSANDMPSEDDFDAIQFEIYYVSGLKPTENTIENFKYF